MIIKLIGVVIGTLTSATLWAMPAPVGEVGYPEVFIEKAFIPPHGFDDNDNIQIVLDGHLPNICYDLAEPKINIDVNTKEIQVWTYAKKKSIHECSEVSFHHGAYLGWPVHFTRTISLGKLPADNYNVVYSLKKDTRQKRSFRVEKAQSSSADDAIYAPLTNVYIPEMIYETNNAEIIITGVLQAQCMELNSADIKIEKFSDIIVVMPVLRLVAGRDCGLSKVPLNQVVSLGELKAGRYLVHVRSMTGEAINRTFTVIKREGDASTSRMPEGL